jgi:membrane associated rhomboid family serine protease
LALRWGWRAFRSVPLTVGYLLALTATTALVSSESAEANDRLLFSFSTNLHQLVRVPARVLVGSAFWTSGWGDLAVWLVLLLAVLAPVERRLGRRRTLLVFAAGHVGATLRVAASLWIGLRIGAVAPSVVFAQDIGVSYGFFAVAALAGYVLAPRARLCYLALLVAYVAVEAGFSHTFTDFGHVTAVAIGLACYPVARASSDSRVRQRRLLPADHADCRGGCAIAEEGLSTGRSS